MHTKEKVAALSLMSILAFSIALPISIAFATTPPLYSLTGTWSFTDVTAIHTMVINSFDSATGVFSGIGYYTADPTLTWTIVGTEAGNIVNYVLTVVTGPYTGVTLTGTGTLTSGTFMSGTGTQSGYGAVTWSATKGTQVVNVVYKVVNAEDSGWNGYWALDSYTKQVQVWQDPNNPQNYYATLSYVGKWATVQGACSPALGVTASEGSAATGTFQGGVFAQFTFTGTIPPGLQTNGQLGPTPRDYGGSTSALASCPQTFTPTNYFSWQNTYFPGMSSYNEYYFSFTYHYQSQTWVDFSTAPYSTGNILT